VKYVVLDSFRADYRRLSPGEQALFRKALPEFVAACERFAAEASIARPASRRVNRFGAPGIWEMTWSFSGPDGRATANRSGSRAASDRWRRIGGAVFKDQ
jgi:hypothetical protein